MTNLFEPCHQVLLRKGWHFIDVYLKSGSRYYEAWANHSLNIWHFFETVCFISKVQVNFIFYFKKKKRIVLALPPNGSPAHLLVADQGRYSSSWLIIPGFWKHWDINCDVEYRRHQLCCLNGTNKSYLGEGNLNRHCVLRRKSSTHIKHFQEMR